MLCRMSKFTIPLRILARYHMLLMGLHGAVLGQA